MKWSWKIATVAGIIDIDNIYGAFENPEAAAGAAKCIKNYWN
jgi:hypothetical protein